MKTTEEKYAKAFNQGYQLSKKNMEILNTLKRGIKKSEYICALEAGEKEYEKEKLQQRLSDLSRIQSKSKNREREI